MFILYFDGVEVELCAKELDISKEFMNVCALLLLVFNVALHNGLKKFVLLLLGTMLSLISYGVVLIYSVRCYPQIWRGVTELKFVLSRQNTVFGVVMMLGVCVLIMRRRAAAAPAVAAPAVAAPAAAPAPAHGLPRCHAYNRRGVQCGNNVQIGRTACAHH